MMRYWSRWLGITLLFSSTTGCATFWEEITSRERDWAYITGVGKPHPLVVLRDSTSGHRRAQALAELHEPLRHGGNAEDQAAYLKFLGAAALGDNEHDEPLCRVTAIRMLGKYHDPRAARILEDVYQQPSVPPDRRERGLPFTPENNSFIRKEALVALENTHDPGALPLLIRVARQPGPPADASLSDRQQTQDEKIVAIRALRNYREQECADALATVLRTEKDIALRDRALQSLEEVTGKVWPVRYDEWQNEQLRPEPSKTPPNHNFIQQVGVWFKR